MKIKFVSLVLVLSLAFVGCHSSKDPVMTNSEELDIEANDTVRIANEEQEYEIIIIEPGFNNWLKVRARPPGYYSQQFLENRNMIMVTEWNNRVMNPLHYDPNLYELQINYDRNIDYGYEVNYKLYYYFIYFQMTYNQRLASFVPRI